ncbi:MarR family winged helix-turn-helix transcriptional regulator [Nocardia donostiensis]|uniref:MarR family transcriptional regulator n=1 Tax=Nocardia donostiensis TaxID=1538463 RepID=A0A1W0B128_9NOCA|nr:MarR family transcriptional regulator [Nocardia donostiensis]ONM48481.1 MarR family transcriptional regulator [Nocardia donostiensis]OQS16131.1 MarR family transcriptional regulator [Nocardia donostiensis]OQS18627.1 MarR family transcriptional regulator [Nocardia donostiensis]
MAERSLRERTYELWRLRNPHLDTSAMVVVGQIKRISALLDRAVEDIYSDAGVSAAEVGLLVPLRYADPPLTAIRLAEHLGMSRAGVGKTLAKLERRGLVVRAQNPADRRSALITLTPRGIDVIDEVFPRELEAHARLLKDLSKDRATVLHSLDRLAVSLEVHGNSRT